MTNIAKMISLSAALCTSLLFAATAQAAASGSAGKTASADVTLGGVAADVFDYAGGVNPQSGKTGSSGFDSDFARYGSNQGWSRVGVFGSSADNGVGYSSHLLGTQLKFTFDKTTSTKGIWTVTNNDQSNNVTLDLVFAMHTGGGSTAWLFNDETLAAGAQTGGTWTMNALNPGGQLGGYSNLTIFARDARLSSFIQTPVPEPETYAMLLAGLGLIGFMSRRRKNEYDTFR